MNFDPKLQTDRLFLGPLSILDFLFFYRLQTNATVRRHLGGVIGHRHIFSKFDQYRRDQGKSGVWVVRRNTFGRAMGLVEIEPHKEREDYEVSYQFLPKFWGLGLAREAVSAVVDHALQDPSLTRVIAETQASNDRSCRLLKSIGMVEIDRIERFGAQQIMWAIGQKDL